jgi:hypothetical protein
MDCAGRVIGSPVAVVSVICGSMGPSFDGLSITISSAAMAMSVRLAIRHQDTECSVPKTLAAHDDDALRLIDVAARSLIGVTSRFHVVQ